MKRLLIDLHFQNHISFWKTSFLFFSLLLFLYPSSLLATTGQILDLSPDARTNALGSAVTSDIQGSASVFHNPAGLATLTTLELSASFRNELVDVNSGSLVVAMPFLRLGTLGLSLYSLHAGILDLPYTDNDPVAELDFIVATSYAIALNSLMTLPLPLNLGVTMKYFHSTLAGDYTGQAAAGDLGVQTILPSMPLHLGLTLKNFGSRITYDLESEPLPTSLVGGVSWHDHITQDFSYSVLLDYAQPLEDKPLIFSGMEVGYRNFIDLRIGYRFLHDATNFSAGFGVRLKPYTFDYAFLNNTLASKHLVTLTYQWIPVKIIPSSRAQEGIDHFKQGNLLAAKKAWQIALKENSNDIFAQKYLDEFKHAREDWITRRAAQAEYEFNNEHYRQAWTIWQSITKENQHHPRVQAGLQKQKKKADQQIQKARSWFNKHAWINALSSISRALDIIPNYFPAKKLEAKTQAAIEQQHKTKKTSQRIISKIKTLCFKGRPLDAEEMAKQALQVSVKNTSLQKAKSNIPKWSHQYALTLKSKNQFQAALTLWKTILKIDPNFSLAKQQYQKTSEFFKKNIQAEHEKAMAAFAQKDYPTAIAAWEKVYILNPEPEVKTNLLRVYEAQGILAYRNDDLDPALTHWKKALQLDPNNRLLKKNIQRAENKLKFIRKLGWEVSP